MTSSTRFALAPLALCLLTSCRDPPRPQPRPTAQTTPVAAPAAQAPRVPAVVADAGEAPSTDSDAATAGGAVPVAAADGGAAGIRVFRVGEPACVRDPARERLGASTHGYFGNDRIELEVRNVRHGCTPGPTFTATLEGTTLHVRYNAPSREALARCACRHDQFLQIVGVPRGAYSVDVAPDLRGDAGAPIATGQITASAR